MSIVDINEWSFNFNPINVEVQYLFQKLPSTSLVTATVGVAYECFVPHCSWLCLPRKSAMVHKNQFTLPGEV